MSEKNESHFIFTRVNINVMSSRRRYSRRGRRRRGNSKATVYSKKGARSQSRQIMRNQNQITALRKRVRQSSSIRYYGMQGHKSNMVYPGYVSPLIEPSEFYNIFNAVPAAVDNSSHATMRTIDIKGLIQVEEGEQVVQVDVYVVQLRKNTAQITQQNLGTDLAQLMDYSEVPALTGTWNKHYYYNTSNANIEGNRGTMLNPKAFKVRAHRQFQVGNVSSSAALGTGTEVTNIGDGNKPFHIKLRHPIKLENTLGQNLTGATLGWRTIPENQVPDHKQLYLMVFCNAVDNCQIFVDWNAVLSFTEPD